MTRKGSHPNAKCGLRSNPPPLIDFLGSAGPQSKPPPLIASETQESKVHTFGVDPIRSARPEKFFGGCFLWSRTSDLGLLLYVQRGRKKFWGVFLAGARASPGWTPEL